jgi:hypothetical protein
MAVRAPHAIVPYSVPRCPHCAKPALRDKRDAEEVALGTAAMMRGRMTCRSCGGEIELVTTSEWVEIGED